MRNESCRERDARFVAYDRHDERGRFFIDVDEHEFAARRLYLQGGLVRLQRFGLCLRERLCLAAFFLQSC